MEKTFAVINADNLVINVIVAESLEIAEEVSQTKCVEYTPENPTGIGWTYDLTTKTFTAPPQPEVEDTPTE